MSATSSGRLASAMALLLEATFIGLFFFGWNRLSRSGIVVTAVASANFPIWIIANGWMQFPVGALQSETA